MDRLLARGDAKIVMYSPKLLDHFQNPRHAGEMPEATSVARVENPVCGDVLELALKVENNRVLEVRFRAKGCVPSMACGSAIAEMIQGRTLGEVQDVTRAELIDYLEGVPPSSEHAVQLAIDVLYAALQKIAQKAHSAKAADG